jgi:hypothetical protein
MSLGFKSDEKHYENTIINGAVTELENAVMAFFWEGKVPRMGTLTVTLPDRSASSLLGDRNRQLGLILGAHLSNITGKMALISVNFPKELSFEITRTLIDLAKDLIKKGEENDRP